MDKTSKITPLFLALAAFLALSIQAHAIPMFGRGERDPNSSASAPAESIEQQRRRTNDKTACDAADLSMEDDEVEHKADELNVSNEVSTSQFSDVVANCGTDPLAPEICFSEKFEKVLSLEKFRAVATNPNFANVERLIIDSDSGLIRPHNKGTDSKTKGKNETIIAALKAALQKEFPRFSPVLIESLVEEELPHSNTWSMFEKLQGRPDLSSKTLQCILEKADNAMTEQAFDEEHVFTLQHFRNALAHCDNHGAERLIISGQGASARIVTQTGNDHTADAIIRKTLKRALENEKHRRDFVHQLISEVLPRSITTRARSSLSFEKLKTIIQRADDEMAEIKLLQTTRSIASPSQTASNRTARRIFFRNSIKYFFSKLGIQSEALVAGISAAAIPKNIEEIAAEQAAAAQQAAWEQGEMEKILRSVICRERNLNALKEHYCEAEAAAIAAEADHNQDEKARWNAEKKTKYLEEARNFFEKVRTALIEKRELAEFDESTLSKISQGADLAGAILGVIDASGLTNLKNITDAISTFATFADRRITIAEAQKAFKRLHAAIQKAEEATEGHEQVEEAAAKIQAHADEIEHLKKQEDYDETLRLSNLVRLPNDTDNTALRQWATELACESDPANENDATVIAHLLYKQAKKTPDQINELVCKLWGERVSLLEQELQQLLEYPPLDTEYERAQQKEIETKTTALVAKVTLEEAAQAQSEWLSKRDQLREQKKFLENQLRSDPEHRKERQVELEAKRRELATLQAQQESINRSYQNRAAEAKRLTAAAARAHVDGFEKFKIFTAAKQLYARNIARLQAAVEIDRKILNTILIEAYKRKEARARKAAAEALTQQTAALEQGDTRLAQLHKGRASALGDDESNPGVAYSYEQAAKEQAKGKKRAAETWLKRAQAYEKEAAALARKNLRSASWYRKIGEIWRYNLEHQEAAVFSYKLAALEQDHGYGEAAFAWRKSAQAWEEQATVLAQKVTTLVKGDEGNLASLHILSQKTPRKALGYQSRAMALGGCYPGAAYLYDQAAKEQLQGNIEIARTFQDIAQKLKTQIGDATILEQFHEEDEDDEEIEDRASTCSFTEDPESVRRDYSAWPSFGETPEKRIRFQLRSGLIHQNSASYSYMKATEQEARGNKRAAQAWLKSAQAFVQAAALAHSNRIISELHSGIGERFGFKGYLSVADSYEKIFEEQSQGHKEAVEALLKSAQAYEESAAALLRLEFQHSNLYKSIALLWGNKKGFGAGAFYSSAARATDHDRPQEAESLRKKAQQAEQEAIGLATKVAALVKADQKYVECYYKGVQACEEEAAALARGDTKAALVHKEMVRAFKGPDNYNLGGAANAYAEAAKEQAQGNKEAAEAWRKSAQAWEEQAKALMERKKKLQNYCNKREIPEILGGHYDNPGVAYAYSRAARVQHNQKAVEAWYKSAEAYKEEAAALARGDSDFADWCYTIAAYLGGGYTSNNQFGVAYFYSRGDTKRAEDSLKRVQKDIIFLQRGCKEAAVQDYLKRLHDYVILAQNRSATSASSDHEVQSNGTLPSSQQQPSPQQEKSSSGSSTLGKKGNGNCTVS